MKRLFSGWVKRQITINVNNTLVDKKLARLIYSLPSQLAMYGQIRTCRILT